MTEDQIRTDHESRENTEQTENTQISVNEQNSDVEPEQESASSSQNSTPSSEKEEKKRTFKSQNEKDEEKQKKEEKSLKEKEKGIKRRVLTDNEKKEIYNEIKNFAIQNQESVALNIDALCNQYVINEKAIKSIAWEVMQDISKLIKFPKEEDRLDMKASTVSTVNSKKFLAVSRKQLKALARKNNFEMISFEEGNQFEILITEQGILLKPI